MFMPLEVPSPLMSPGVGRGVRSPGVTFVPS
jgi:hypothetical protein